ncbi:hypothetical protein [Natranaerobius thermophilus]|uniref:Uncharacterized protein n=1 Tax=Natranaerobius thermophilus (strain ATCC BAA-1301 / DSM 18059 / JW/NM-WN-LF) TaxID=457570 RepID=B2A5B3_NATTJ|nr:hypothetical protein [Natranaerobius thermophilus]ACB83947.1 hypothetical protein Nther_0350 [Natranaerobius thermophilus JW/NM-WN-LF]
MSAVKALLYLEKRSIINRIKEAKKFKLQVLGMLLFGIAVIFSFVSSNYSHSTDISEWFVIYSEELIYLLIIITIGLNIAIGSKRIPLQVPYASNQLIFEITSSTKIIIGYFFGKQLLFNVITTLVATYALIIFLTDGILTTGMVITWLGLLLLNIWSQSLALLTYGIKKRFNINIELIFIIIGVSIGSYVLTKLIIDGPTSLIETWGELINNFLWPLEWLFNLISFGFFTRLDLPYIDILLGIILIGLTIVLAFKCLPNSREPIITAMLSSQRISESTNDEMDIQEALMTISRPNPGQLISRLNIGTGFLSAIVWKDLIYWERLKLNELKLVLIAVTVVSGGLGWIVAYFNLSMWLILLPIIYSSWNGGKAAIELKRLLIYQLPTKGWKKILSVSIFPIIENILNHIIAIIVFGTFVFLGSGNLEFQKLFSILIVGIGMNILLTILGLIVNLATIDLIGFYRKIIQLLIMALHFTTIIAIANLVLWNPLVINLLIGLILLYSFVFLIFTSKWCLKL